MNIFKILKRFIINVQQNISIIINIWLTSNFILSNFVIQQVILYRKIATNTSGI